MDYPNDLGSGNVEMIGSASETHPIGPLPHGSIFCGKILQFDATTRIPLYEEDIKLANEIKKSSIVLSEEFSQSIPDSVSNQEACSEACYQKYMTPMKRKENASVFMPIMAELDKAYTNILLTQELFRLVQTEQGKLVGVEHESTNQGTVITSRHAEQLSACKYMFHQASVLLQSASEKLRQSILKNRRTTTQLIELKKLFNVIVFNHRIFYSPAKNTDILAINLSRTRNISPENLLRINVDEKGDLKMEPHGSLQYHHLQIRLCMVDDKRVYEHTLFFHSNPCDKHLVHGEDDQSMLIEESSSGSDHSVDDHNLANMKLISRAKHSLLCKALFLHLVNGARSIVVGSQSDRPYTISVKSDSFVIKVSDECQVTIQLVTSTDIMGSQDSWDSLVHSHCEFVSCSQPKMNQASSWDDNTASGSVMCLSDDHVLVHMVDPLNSPHKRSVDVPVHDLESSISTEVHPRLKQTFESINKHVLYELLSISRSMYTQPTAPSTWHQSIHKQMFSPVTREDPFVNPVESVKSLGSRTLFIINRLLFHFFILSIKNQFVNVIYDNNIEASEISLSVEQYETSAKVEYTLRLSKLDINNIVVIETNGSIVANHKRTFSLFEAFSFVLEYLMMNIRYCFLYFYNRQMDVRRHLGNNLAVQNGDGSFTILYFIYHVPDRVAFYHAFIAYCTQKIMINGNSVWLHVDRSSVPITDLAVSNSFS